MPRTEHTIANRKAVKKALHELACDISVYRQKHSLSRRALAELVGCSESNIKNIETEESSPSFAVLVMLKEAMQ